MPLSVEEKAYLAGILDGEGCISIMRRGKYLTPTVQVTNTRIDLLQWLKARWSGGIYSTSEKRTNRKPAWLWSLAGQKAVNVLRDAEPYLLIKSEHARLVLALPRYYATERDKLGRIKGTMTPERIVENETLVSNIRRLNRRGAI